MAERKQAKACRLVAEDFNEYFESLGLGETDPKELRIIVSFITKTQWTMVLVMKQPLVMYWEVTYSTARKSAVVKPYLPYGQHHYPDVPERKLKAVT